MRGRDIMREWWKRAVMPDVANAYIQHVRGTPWKWQALLLIDQYAPFYGTGSSQAQAAQRAMRAMREAKK